METLQASFWFPGHSQPVSLSVIWFISLTLYVPAPACLTPLWDVSASLQRISGALVDPHVAFLAPGLEHRPQPVQSGPSLTSLRWCNYLAMTSRPVCRGSWRDVFHCFPIVLIAGPDCFIPCPAGCILCLSKSCVYSSGLQGREILHCCKKGSYSGDGRKKGSCCRLPMAPFHHSRSFSNRLSQIRSRLGHHRGCSEHQEVNTLLATAPQPFPAGESSLVSTKCPRCREAKQECNSLARVNLHEWTLIRFNIFKWVFCRPHLHFRCGKAAGAPTAAEVSGLHRFCRGKFSHSCCKHHHTYLPDLILTQIINKRWITQIWKLFRTILVFVWS